MRVDLSLECQVCLRLGRDSMYGGRCECGANTWLETAPLPPRPPVPPRLLAPTQGSLLPPQGAPVEPVRVVPGFVRGAGVPDSVVDDFEGARLNELLGGVKRGALILIVGRAGAGKSTSTAQLVAFVAEHWTDPASGCDQRSNCDIYWLDADQKDASLVRTCFNTAEVEDIFENRVVLLPPRAEPYTWQEALDRVPSDARIVVWDSLEAWGRTDPERLKILQAIRARPAWLNVVIGGTNKEGGISGVESLERADDATVFAERTDDDEYLLRFTKRRWRPCASAAARGAGKRRSGPARRPLSATTRSAPEAGAAAGTAAPDFSAETVAAAARWSVRELESYRAQLRAQSVPRDSIEGWNRAVLDAQQALTSESDQDDEPPVLH